MRRPLRLVPKAETLHAPLIRSPSQWAGTMRVAASAGRSAIDVIRGIWPRRSVPRFRGRRALRARRNATSSSHRRVPRGNRYSTT